MDVIAAWLLMPVVALAVSLGIGLLVERASGARLPGVLLAPLGMAGLVAVGQVTTTWDWSAELTVPLCAVLAVAGWVVGWRRLRRPDPWALASAAGVFAVFAAPIVLSGSATFAGYTILGDTSIHFIGADALLEHGRDVAGLPPSSYAAARERLLQRRELPVRRAGGRRSPRHADRRRTSPGRSSRSSRCSSP